MAAPKAGKEWLEARDKHAREFVMTVETVEVQCRDCIHLNEGKLSLVARCVVPVPDYINGMQHNVVKPLRISNCPAFEAVPCPYTEKPKGPPNRVWSSKDAANIKLDPDDIKATLFGLAVVFGLIIFAGAVVHFTTGIAP